MNTIKAVLDENTKKGLDGYLPEITVYTRGGKQFTGSLAHWDARNAPNLVRITSNTDAAFFVNVADIEAVGIN